MGAKPELDLVTFLDVHIELFALVQGGGFNLGGWLRRWEDSRPCTPCPYLPLPPPPRLPSPLTSSSEWGGTTDIWGQCQRSCQVPVLLLPFDFHFWLTVDLIGSLMSTNGAV